MPAPSTDSAGSLQASSGQVPSQSLRQSASWRRNQEFNRRRALIEYTLCNDEDIWNEMKQEEIQAKEAKKTKKAKPLVIPANPQLESELNAFLLDTFQNEWDYTPVELDLTKKNLKPEIIHPSRINWDQRRQDVDASKSGQYTLNPETQNLNFEKAKIFIPDPETLKQFEGKPLADIAKHIQTTYGSKYYIPGIEYWEYVSRNPDKVPQSLNDSQIRYFYFGSILRFYDGDYCLPFSFWDGSSFEHDVFSLGFVWSSNCQVVLLDK